MAVEHNGETCHTEDKGFMGESQLFLGRQCESDSDVESWILKEYSEARITMYRRFRTRSCSKQRPVAELQTVLDLHIETVGAGLQSLRHPRH